MLHLLRTHVQQRPLIQYLPFLIRQNLTEPKIRDFQNAPLRHQNIARLYIAVDYAAVVGEFEGLAGLADGFEDVVFGEVLALFS